MKDILVLLGMFVAGALFMWLRPKIFKQAKKQVRMVWNEAFDKTERLNASIGNVFKANGDEPFQWKKFTGGFLNIGSLKDWGKDIVSLFNVRKLTIYILIISVVFGYGWWKGTQGKPIKVDIGYGKEAKIGLEGGQYLHIDKTGRVYLKDKNGNILKTIGVKDIEGLKRKLAPIGLQFEPIAIMGAGMGISGFGGEAGVGISWLRYWKWRMDAFITNRGLYPLATSYRLTTNSGIGVGVGMGWEGDTRTIVYYNWKF